MTRAWALVVGAALLSGLSGCRTTSHPHDGAATTHERSLKGPSLPPPVPAAPVPVGPERGAVSEASLDALEPESGPVLPPPPDEKPPSLQQPALPDGPALGPTTSAEDRPTAVQPVVAEKPALRTEPLVEALRCALDNRPEEALRHLKDFDPATQELFIRLLPPMALLSHKKLDQLSPPEVASLHEQLQSLVVALRPRTELSIGKMCFCEWIRSYGVYKPVAENHAFQAGAPGQPGELVQLYVELHNFRCERRDSYHETRLASSVELFDANGTRVWYYRFDDRKQPLRSLSPLRDFFNNYSFHLPREVPPGQYTLTLQVVDETLSDQPRAAKKSLPMTVRAP